MKKGKSLQRALSVVIAGVLLSGILGSNFVAQALDETNLALGKTVALTIGGGGTDNDPQGVTHEGGSVYTIAEVEQESVNRLTDGVKLADSGAEFEENWVNGKWNELSGTRSKYVQFYRNMNRELDLDLGQISNVTSLSMSFGACSAYGISAPVSVSYYISEDGENYYLAGKVLSADTVAEETACTGDTPMAHSYYELTGLNYNIRYVKICFDVNVWLFTDEIEIVGTIEESAEADPLPTTPYLPELVVNAYATEELSGGIKNEELAYAGWYKSGSELKTSVKTETELLHTIAYVDEEGTPTDWLFNSITFLNHGYDDQGRYTVYHNDVNSASQYTDKAGWESYLDHIFDYSDATDNSYNLGALDAAVADARETLNDPDYAVGVKIQIMPPVHVQSDWGQLVDGEGDSLDFTVEGAGSEEAALANRLAAVSWYINEVISRFEEKSYQNITLDGFYYFDEVIRLSDDTIAAQTIQGITRAVHDNSMKIYWIPYYQAEGFSKWSSFGFDYAIMQPNYAFYNDASVTRIADCAALAKKYGLGIEMELGSLVDDENQRLTKFKEYLTQGADDDLGYQNHSLISWYTGTQDLYNASNNVGGARYIYDAIYQFLQGYPVVFEEDEGPDIPEESNDDDSESAGDEDKNKIVPVTEGDKTTCTVKPENYGSDTFNKVIVSKTDISEAVAQASAAAKKSGTKAVVEIQIESTEQTRQAQATIPVASLNKIVKSDVSGLVVSSGVASILFDTDALRGLSEQTAEDSIRIVAGKIDASSLSQSVMDTIGDAEVYEFSIFAGTAGISSFNGGKASVTIPYTLKKGESADGITVWYIGSDGTLQKVEDAEYNKDNKTVTFETTHFSTYAISFTSSVSSPSGVPSDNSGGQTEQIPDTGDSRSALPVMLTIIMNCIFFVILNKKHSAKE